MFLVSELSAVHVGLFKFTDTVPFSFIVSLRVTVVGSDVNNDTASLEVWQRR